MRHALDAAGDGQSGRTCSFHGALDLEGARPVSAPLASVQAFQ